MSATLSPVSSSSRRAKCTRRVRATASGAAPSCPANSRRSQRPVTPRRAASPSTPDASSAPSSISRSARATVADVPDHAGLPGAVSGRQRRHGRKPALSAAAGQAKKRTFRRAGRRAGQPGRQ